MEPKPYRKTIRRSGEGPHFRQPANIVPGIGFSMTRCSWGGCSTIGGNPALPARYQLQQHPVNAPKCQFRSVCHRRWQESHRRPIGRNVTYNPTARGFGTTARFTTSRRMAIRGRSGAFSIIASTTITGSSRATFPEDDLGSEPCLLFREHRAREGRCQAAHQAAPCPPICTRRRSRLRRRPDAKALGLGTTLRWGGPPSSRVAKALCPPDSKGKFRPAAKQRRATSSPAVRR